MAISHARPGEVIPLVDGDPFASGVSGTRTLLKTSCMEVIRLVLPRGKTISRHQAPGEILVQGLTGRVRFTTMGTTIEIESGQLFYLSAAEPHEIMALEDCSFLLTILLNPKVKETSES
jgi:quercetin dioxygenase-like cupin family protein